MLSRFNELVVTRFIFLPLFLFYFILLYFIFNIMDETIKLVDHLLIILYL